MSSFPQIDLGQSKLVFGMKLAIISIYPEMATNLEVVSCARKRMFIILFIQHNLHVV